MRYLLDTCVPSELTKPKPSQRVLDWMNAQDIETLYLSAATIGEIQRGIYLLPPSNRRTNLETWLNVRLAEEYANRILPLDEELFRAWGSLMAKLKLAGHPMALFDSLIAATAIHHRMTLVTRNVDDFRYADISLLNPWEE